MKSISFILVMVITLSLSGPVAAQSNFLPAQKVSLVMEVAPENPPGIIAAISEDTDRSLDDVLFNTKVVINLFRTTGLAKVHLKMGSSPGRVDYGAQSFTIGNAPELIVSGRTLFVDMGQVQGYPSIYVEAVLESETGQLSEAQYFIPTTH